MSDAATHFSTEALGEPAGPGRYVSIGSIDPAEFVPGRPFYTGGAGARQLRLAYSRVAGDLIGEGIRRLADLTRAALPGNFAEES